MSLIVLLRRYFEMESKAKEKERKQKEKEGKVNIKTP